MSHDYYFNLVNGGTQLEVGETNDGNDWGVFYTTAKVTNAVDARAILLPLLEEGIRDGAVLNCHLGLAGICPSWQPDETARIWTQYKGSKKILVQKARWEWEQGIESWTSHEDLNHTVQVPDEMAVLDLISEKEYPTSAEALVAVANAIASMLK